MSKIKPSFKSKQTNKQKTARPWGTMWLLPAPPASSHPCSLQPEPRWPFLSYPSVPPPLSPQGLFTHKPLWLKFPLQHTPKELLFIPHFQLKHLFSGKSSMTPRQGQVPSYSHSSIHFFAALAGYTLIRFITRKPWKEDRVFSAHRGFLAPSTIPSVLWVLDKYLLSLV